MEAPDGFDQSSGAFAVVHCIPLPHALQCKTWW